MDAVATASKTPRRRRRARNRARIVDAAVEIALSRGYDAVHVKDVADAADYTPGALYRYFPSRDALLAAAVSQLVERLADGFEALEAEPGTPPLTAIARYTLAYARFAAEEPHAFGLMATMLADPRVLLPEEADAALLLHALRRALGPLHRALTAAEAAGDVEAGEDVRRAILLFASAQGTLQLRKAARFPGAGVDPGAFLAELLETLLRGFGASACAAREAIRAAQDSPLPALTVTARS